MTDQQRDWLTLFCLALLAYGCWRAIHASINADMVYNTMPGARARVRDPLQIAKRLIVVEHLFLLLGIQGWANPLGLLRPIAFVGAMITIVLIGIYLDRGYTRWWTDVKPYADRIMRRP